MNVERLGYCKVDAKENLRVILAAEGVFLPQ
jgi:hypothetical protein